MFFHLCCAVFPIKGGYRGQKTVILKPMTILHRHPQKSHTTWLDFLRICRATHKFCRFLIKILIQHKRQETNLRLIFAFQIFLHLFLEFSFCNLLFLYLFMEFFALSRGLFFTGWAKFCNIQRKLFCADNVLLRRLIKYCRIVCKCLMRLIELIFILEEFGRGGGSRTSIFAPFFIFFKGGICNKGDWNIFSKTTGQIESFWMRCLL